MKRSDFRAWSMRVLLVVVGLSAGAQEVTPSPATANRDIAAELLKLPPLGQNDGDDYWDSIAYFIRQKREPETEPGRGATLYELAQYWREKSTQGPDRLPDDLRKRLLEACERFPQVASQLAHLTPRTDDAARRLLALLDRISNDGPDFSSRSNLIQYLRRNSNFFRPQLLDYARAAKEGEGVIEFEGDVRALARLDWKNAAPLLAAMIKPGQPRLTALALGLQYQHAVQISAPQVAALRGRLKGIAVDPSSPAKARDLAIEALMATDWRSRDAWFLSLLGDDLLGFPVDGVNSFSTLEDPVHRDPDRWVPRILPLVQHPNPVVRRNAAYILVSFERKESRTDAATALLPWLFDPKWVIAEDSGHTRHNLIYTLSQMKIPESVPGLLHVLGDPEEADVWEIAYAAEAVSQFQDPRAAPILRQLLTAQLDHNERLAVGKALLASGGVSQQEKVQAVTALARQLANRRGREQLNQAELNEDSDRIEGQVILGLAVIESEGKDPDLVKALRKQVQEVRDRDPETAESLTSILDVLPDEERDGNLVYMIGRGTADASAIRELMARRDWLSEGDSNELELMAKTAGAPMAIAAVLLQDSELELDILEDEDVVAKTTLLAALRLAGDSVDEAAVRRLMNSEDLQLAEAAKAYCNDVLVSRYAY